MYQNVFTVLRGPIYQIIGNEMLIHMQKKLLSRSDK